MKTAIITTDNSPEYNCTSYIFFQISPCYYFGVTIVHKSKKQAKKKDSRREKNEWQKYEEWRRFCFRNIFSHLSVVVVLSDSMWLMHKDKQISFVVRMYTGEFFSLTFFQTEFFTHFLNVGVDFGFSNRWCARARSRETKIVSGWMFKWSKN